MLCVAEFERESVVVIDIVLVRGYVNTIVAVGYVVEMDNDDVGEADGLSETVRLGDIDIVGIDDSDSVRESEPDVE